MRGLALDALNNSAMWWGGPRPPFFRESESNWLQKSASDTFGSTPNDLPGIKSQTISMTSQVGTDAFSVRQVFIAL